MNARKHQVLVGVTGQQENTSALTWAAQTAARHDSDVTLVHAVSRTLVAPPPSVLMAPEPLVEVGAQIVKGVVTEYADLTGGAPVHELVRVGTPSRVLSELSEHADLVVLSHRRLSAPRRILTRSTSVAVAAHAHCPVVSVPVGWTAPSSGERRWVTVGVHESGEPDGVLRAAFAAAAELALPLRLVHAWREDPQYQDVIDQRVEPGWRERTRQEVRDAVAAIAAEHPQVEVDVVAEHDWPADALTTLGDSSMLLVVGRHAQHPPLPMRLGSVARSVVMHADCPVMVVPV